MSSYQTAQGHAFRELFHAEMRCLFVVVGPNALSIVLPHWNNIL